MADKGKLLIVDDELVVRDSLGKWFIEDGFEIGLAESASEALTKLAEGDWEVALVDIKMPGIDGIELQRRLQQIDPDLKVIIMTGYASVDTAVQALKNGAYDYVTKPFDPDEISHVVHNALTQRRTSQEVSRLREAVSASVQPREFIGQSAAVRKVIENIDVVGPTDTTVLITGESGTGKELVARLIHAASRRRYHPMVVIHCGALNDTLLESELFGHERGAFTGAQHRRKGKFEIAEGGTVFLDEIGDISLKTQTDLLRVLQEHEISRVGGNLPIKVDFRCVAATHKDLEAMIETGQFRLDLYYRLNVFHIKVPPLRERREDIPLLADHFVRKFSLAMNKRIQRVTPAAMAILQQQEWRGNVRELENAVERAMVVAREPELVEEDFPLRPPRPSSEPRTVEEVERAHILRVLEECGANQTRAAEVLDIDRVTLHNKLKKYGWTKKTSES
ncbi:MAG: sigma-54-dependent Fis family transcriptional regulator [Candidatus Riflebacteria bacterium]|nr:sigma-54-dependent Fis family transcriptional regulator [Candidatus Riflebacteria bacterium]